MGEAAIAFQEDYDENYNYLEYIDKKGYKRLPPFFSGDARPQFEISEDSGIPKFIFKSDEILLRAIKPVTIFLSKGEDLWFAENDRLSIYATGKNSIDAINDFTIQLLYFHEHYTSLPDEKLLKHARELKQIYSENFIRVA